MRHREILLALALGLVPLSLLAGAVDEKGFIFTAGADARLRAEPKSDANETAAPPVGGRLLFKKVVREGDAIGWYFIEQPGVGTGWLAAAEASAKRASALPSTKPVKRVELGAPAAPASKNVATAGPRSLAQSASAQTAGARTLAARAAAAQGKSEAEGDAILREATIDLVTLERVIGIQMSDPPHPDGRYADLTARGRKADAEQLAKAVAEGD